MSAQSRMRSKELAAYLKANKITRDTGKCPWGCGANIHNGGQDLLQHLLKCKGSQRVYSRRRANISKSI